MNVDKILLLSLFGGYTVKLLALGAQPADAAVVLILAASHFLYTSQIQNKKVSLLEARIEKFEQQMAEHKGNIDDVKTAVASVKIASGFRQPQAR